MKQAFILCFITAAIALIMSVITDSVRGAIVGLAWAVLSAGFAIADAIRDGKKTRNVTVLPSGDVWADEGVSVKFQRERYE